MKKFFRLVVCIISGVLLLPSIVLADAKEATVKIFTTASSPSYYIPWSNNIENSSGSGSIITGNKILTNAHVIANATYIEVLRYGEAETYTARVDAVSHDADLALLTVDDLSFFEGVTPLDLGILPELQDEVLVLGYPTGGEGLSLTQGVVSRIELRTYAHSKMDLLSLQIDAAINSGNSGGPVLHDGKIVGVAMQTLTNAENIGHVIPVPVVRHFIDDMKDGAYDGFPADGGYIQPMNETLRRYVGLPSDEGGVFVNRIVPGSSSQGYLRIGDVVLAINGHAVASDGSALLRKGLRVNSDYLVHMSQLGELVSFLVWRDGQKLELEFELTTSWQQISLVKQPQFDQKPEYYIYGGLVFTPLTLNLLEQWGAKWYEEGPSNYLHYYFNAYKSHIDEEIVVLSKILNSELTSGYTDFEHNRVLTLNGEEFLTFDEFVALIESTQGEFVIFGLEGGLMVMIDRKQHESEIQAIMELYDVPAPQNRH